VDVESLFLRGKESADRGNHDYAIAIFTDALHIAPDHRNSRIALRGCELERFRDRGGGIKAKLIGFFKGFAHLCKILVPGGKPGKMIDWCERYLANDPTNILVLKRLAAACAAAGYLEAAADTLEFARQRRPRNISILRRLGEIRYQLGEYDKAVRCFQQITNIKPDDRDASQRGKEISAESHLKRSHLEGATSYRETLRDEETARDLEREGHLARSAREHEEEIARANRAVEDNPLDAKAHHALGDLYSKLGRYAEAERAYIKAFELDKRYGTREKLGNTRLRLLEQRERKAQEEAEDSGQDPRCVAMAREARRKRLEFCIKEFTFRRKQHPTEMKLALQLGQYYFELGGDENIRNAIQQFQQAVSSSALKMRAQYMLGRCFAMNPKTLDMARDQFMQALEAVDDPAGEMGKTLACELGATEEKLGNRAEALAWYKKVFVVDAGFRDVAQKIQELG